MQSCYGMRWGSIIVLVGSAALPAACDQDSGQPAEAPPAAAPNGAQVERQAPIDMEVAWPAPGELDHGVLAALSPDNRRAIAISRVPVLVASDPALVANAVVIARPAFTAISSRHDGVTISLHAHRRAHRHPEVPPTDGDRLIRGHKGFVTQNEAIWSASWMENGIAYDLDVECAALPDVRCDDDSYLLALAGSLRYVGGKAHAAEVLR
jgi:hypothetical protein